MTTPPRRPRRRKLLDPAFAPEISSFRLHLAAEDKASETVRTYTARDVRRAGEEAQITGSGTGSSGIKPLVII